MPDFQGGKHKHEQIKICASGAAEAGHCGLDAFDRAKELGREIVRHGAVLTTGATTGFPLWVAAGVKEAGGFAIGFSPASTEREHREVYRLPVDYHDVVVYTGFGYSGRNLILTRSSDAVIIGCGRIGTLNEFTVAYEDQRPIGVLQGSWKTDEVIQYVLENSHRPADKVIFDDDPKRLLEKVIALVRKEKAHHRVYASGDTVGGTAGERIL